MVRKVEATVWMIVKIGERSVLKRIVKKGSSYVPNVEGPYVSTAKVTRIGGNVLFPAPCGRECRRT